MINTFNTLGQAADQGYGGLIMMVLFFIIMWVVLIRPQQKRAKALREKQANVKKGDNVVTVGGMHGVVNSVSEGTVSVRLAEGLFVKFDKSAIGSVNSRGEAKEVASK